jgi:hypothetical protein
MKSEEMFLVKRYAGRMSTSKSSVRDLLWVVNSPHLLQLQDSYSVLSQPLRECEIEPEHLHRWLGDSSPLRLGYYFEQLVYYWLAYVRGCSVVARSHQVVVEKRTLGEIDLIFEDDDGQLTHWEIAVKFYLHCHQVDSSAHVYLGPNSNDTLEKKRQRLLDHQLPLSLVHFPPVKKRQAFVKGRIFYHWKDSNPNKGSNILSAEHLKSRWLRRDELLSFVAEQSRRYCVLRKPFWLADLLADECLQDSLSGEQIVSLIENHFRDHQNPVLISVLQDGLGSSPEVERLFVVPNGWPNQ